MAVAGSEHKIRFSEWVAEHKGELTSCKPVQMKRLGILGLYLLKFVTKLLKAVQGGDSRSYLEQQVPQMLLHCRESGRLVVSQGSCILG